MATLRQSIRKTLRKIGFDLVRYPHQTQCTTPLPSDMQDDARAIYDQVSSYTMTSPERIMALLQAVEFIVQSKIPGDIVECGVWRGGSMMAAALSLQKLGDTSRELYLYDTFEGMTDPTEKDRTYDGRTAKDICTTTHQKTESWCYASLEEVKHNLLQTGYPEEKIHFVQGRVEETIPKILPRNIALLRLDTDWYESTLHELQHLYPLLSENGLLIIDDYGHWEGAKLATDEYFQDSPKTYLHRIDYTGRLIQKT